MPPLPPSPCTRCDHRERLASVSALDSGVNVRPRERLSALVVAPTYATTETTPHLGSVCAWLTPPSMLDVAACWATSASTAGPSGRTMMTPPLLPPNPAHTPLPKTVVPGCSSGAQTYSTNWLPGEGSQYQLRQGYRCSDPLLCLAMPRADTFC